MKKQIFSSLVTLSFISSLFVAGCERTKNTDEIPQATPEPIEIPVDTLTLAPTTPDTLGQAYMDSVAVADSIALAKAADTLKTGAKGNTVATSKTSTKKSTVKSTTKTTTPSGTGTTTSTTKKGTGTNTGTGGTSTSTQKKGSGASNSTGTGGGTTTSTQKKGSNP